MLKCYNEEPFKIILQTLKLKKCTNVEKNAQTQPRKDCKPTKFPFFFEQIQKKKKIHSQKSSN